METILCQNKTMTPLKILDEKIENVNKNFTKSIEIELIKPNEINITLTRKCSRCQKEKLLNEFYARRDREKTQHKSICKTCSKKWRNDNKQKLQNYKKFFQRTCPEQKMLSNAKARAKKYGLPFNLTLEDIYIPEKCPVFDIPLKSNIQGKLPHEASPSLDKIVPELGYVKGNVMVISFRANTLKRDGKLEDFEKISSYIRKYSIKNCYS